MSYITELHLLNALFGKAIVVDVPAGDESMDTFFQLLCIYDASNSGYILQILEG